MYREGANKCSIGHLIPDDIYTPSMEIGTVARLMVSSVPGPAVKAFLRAIMAAGADQEFLTGLQSVHDGCGDGANYRERFAAKMRHFAKSNGLSAAVIDEVEGVSG